MHAIIWMNLKSTVLSKSSHKRLHTILHNSIYITFWQRQTMGTKIRSVVTRSCGKGVGDCPQRDMKELVIMKHPVSCLWW